MTLIVKKIISGGQTGADRAALDAAIEYDIPHGGCLPRGRKAEDGPLPARYQLRELASPDYRKRTRQNVIDSDGTLIVSHGVLSGGSQLTRAEAKRNGRPCLHLDLEKVSGDEALVRLAGWLSENQIEILNVAGPRASGDPSIYDKVHQLVSALLAGDGGF